MKRLIFSFMFMFAALSAMAGSVHYFTRSQAIRVAHYLNTQDEMMIYCGYENELETYVLLNEVWYEPVNSQYFELWVYGYDAYTGEEIFMPFDLDCIWLQHGYSMFNAAKYLRFRCEVYTPNIVWSVPTYSRYTRVVHPAVYTRTYHYDVHSYGWIPPAPPVYHPSHPMPPAPPIHPYYMRRPTEAPRVPQGSYTPGKERPQYTDVATSATSSRPAPSSSRPSSSSSATKAAGSSSNGVFERPASSSQRPNSSSSSAKPSPKTGVNTGNESSTRPASSTRPSTVSGTTRPSSSTTTRPSTSASSTSRPSTSSSSSTTRPATSSRPTTSGSSRPTSTLNGESKSSKSSVSSSSSSVSRPSSSSRTNATSSRPSSSSSRPSASTGRVSNSGNSGVSRPSGASSSSHAAGTSRPASSSSRPK